MRCHVRCFGFMVALAVTLPGWYYFAVPEQGWAQEPDSAPAPSSDLELIFEREVFTYPSFERRNPFQALTGDESGPRFEDVLLLGVVLDADPRRSIAVLGARPPGATSDQPATRTFRVRTGETLGNMRILSVARREVLVEVAEFGVSDTRALTMRPPESARVPLPPPDTFEDVAPEPAVDELGPPGGAGDAAADPSGLSGLGAWTWVLGTRGDGRGGRA